MPPDPSVSSWSNSVLRAHTRCCHHPLCDEHAGL